MTNTIFCDILIKYVTKDRQNGEENRIMSKYTPLWEYVSGRPERMFRLTFDEIEDIAGVPIDHSFLKYRKELAGYGCEAGKISMKDRTVTFNKLD